MKFKLKPVLISHILLLFCIADSIFSNSYAQLNSGNLSQYVEKDGLPDVQVNDVLLDKLGYVWTGTGNGLVRYDGYEFKRFYYNPNDTGSIRGLVVWSLFQDHEGKIWVGTSPSFLNVYNPATKAFRQYNFTHLIKHPANVELNTQVMCEDNKGRMYFGINTYFGDPVSSALLYKDENDTTIKRFATPDSLNIQNVYRIINDKTGNVWLFSYSGIFKIDTKRRLSRFRSLDAELINNTEYPGDLQFDKAGHLWIITQKLRLFDFNLTTGSYTTWFPDSSNTSKEFEFIPKKIIIDNDDNIWLGTNNGVQFFNRQTGKFSRFNNGVKKDLEHTPVVDLTFDDFGTLWIGSYKDGLIKYENKPQLKSYRHNDNEKNSLTTGWANFICESSDGKIWITTSGSRISSGLNILDSKTGKIQPIRYSGITGRINGVTAFWEKAPGEFYLGAFNALYTFSEKDRKLKLATLPGIPDTSVITFYYKDNRLNEWICTYNGVYKKTNGTPEYIHSDLSQVKESDATSNRVSMVYESKKHGLWILTDNGLFLYNYANDKIERHGNDKTRGNIFITQDINSIYEDPTGNVWAGMWQGGLSRYNVEAKQIKTYTINEGLPSMSIQAILADEKNNALWLSTFDGLSRFNINTQQFNNYTISDGIQGQLFADASFLKTSTGLFAFGGSNGITIFNPAEINKTSLPPKVFLTDLKLFNKSIIPGETSILKKPINETYQVIFKYNQNNISIEFVAIHYSNAAKNSYSYKLENYDNEWRDVGNQRTAFYPNLPPGKYVFRVKAANDKGVWNENGASVSIIVKLPWWRTTWAYIIYGMLLVAVAFGLDRYFRRRLINKERERNRARELEQAKEIEKAYYKLEETYQTLQSTQSQLIQSEKMASLGELTAGIAHEIQNPLNFVNNFSEVNRELVDEMEQALRKDDKEEAIMIASDIKENLEKINHHGQRADAIVKGMLQHSRISTGQKEPTDLNALADEYLRLSYHGLRAKDKSFNAILKTNFDESLSAGEAGIGEINIVRQDIGRVLLNLYNNAFYAVTEKSKQQSENYQPTVSVSTKKINNKVEIRVRDNGNGIPQKVTDKIFQPFFTTKPAGQGTGLGLSLSYDIIKAHGGQIKIETKEGEGSEFIIQLPVK